MTELDRREGVRELVRERGALLPVGGLGPTTRGLASGGGHDGRSSTNAGIGEPGVVVHTGGPTSITVGELDGRASERAEALVTSCRAAGFGAEDGGGSGKK